jgi:hypothetical protein
MCIVLSMRRVRVALPSRRNVAHYQFRQKVRTNLSAFGSNALPPAYTSSATIVRRIMANSLRRMP